MIWQMDVYKLIYSKDKTISLILLSLNITLTVKAKFERFGIVHFRLNFHSKSEHLSDRN